MTAHDEDVANDVWLAKYTPIDLGDGEHRAGWTEEGNVFYVHECTGGRYQLGTIDVTSGQRQYLAKREPLHIEGSILCPLCNDHGFIWFGKWEAA